MNKRQRTKWFKRQLLEYGARVVREEKNPPRKDYLPYKKGSYYLCVEHPLMSGSFQHINKYKAYQIAFNTLKEIIKKDEQKATKGIDECV